jgi:hypothetical protein
LEFTAPDFALTILNFKNFEKSYFIFYGKSSKNGEVKAGGFVI